MYLPFYTIGWEIKQLFTFMYIIVSVKNIEKKEKNFDGRYTIFFDGF